MNMRRRAEISKCGQYRYLLERFWGRPAVHANILTVCMLNPSKADALVDDATVRWLIGYAKLNGYDGLRIVNLAAFRATSPAEMLEEVDPHGIENSMYLRRYCSGKTVLCAWGTNGAKLPRFHQMLSHMPGAKLVCIMTNKDGSPGHPLRKSHKLEMKEWLL